MESTFASRIRQYRQDRGLSQQALAELCGLTQGNIAHMENGTEPKQSNVSKLIAGLPDLSPDWLLTGNGPMLRDGRALSPSVAQEPAAPTMRILPDDKEVSYLKERLKDKDTMIEILREQLDRLSQYLPDQLGKLLPDSYTATESRARIGFEQQLVTMTCDGRSYPQVRYEAQAIGIVELKTAA